MWLLISNNLTKLALTLSRMKALTPGCRPIHHHYNLNVELSPQLMDEAILILEDFQDNSMLPSILQLTFDCFLEDLSRG